MIRTPRFAAVFLALLLFSACRTGKILLTPIPQRVESIEGYASLMLTGNDETVRSKFAFLLMPPERGRIEVSNFFAGTVYQMIFTEDAAYFVVPSKGVFWKGAAEEVLDRFLGFPLSLNEVIRLISGRWDDSSASEWSLERDGRGRILSGRRGELLFTVAAFTKRTPLPRRIMFSHPFNRGSLTLLRIGFNTARSNAAFSLAFRDRYQQKTWEEILELIHAPD